MPIISEHTYAVLHMKGWSMVLPHRDIISIELLSDAICTRKGRQLNWWIKWGEKKVDVYALGENALPMGVEDFEGSALVLLGNNKLPVMGLTCKTIDVVNGVALGRAHKIPTLMSSAEQLFSGLVVYEGNLLALSVLDRVTAYCMDACHD